jgi:hypothetical protein
MCGGIGGGKSWRARIVESLQRSCKTLEKCLEKIRGNLMNGNVKTKLKI